MASYQHGIPAVHQFEGTNNNVQTDGFSSSSRLAGLFRSGRGDVSLNPNVGLTNRYEYALFGLALHELIDYIRIGTISLCCLTALFISITTIFKRFFHLSLLILSYYTIFFVVLLAASDCISIVGNKYEFTKSANEFFIDNLGLLLHPFPGRVLYLCLCATLCFGIEGTFEFMFGCGYLLLGFITTYCWFVYPTEYRKPYQEMEQYIHQKYYSNSSSDQNQQQPIAFWSSYYNYARSSNTEQQALIQEHL